MSTATKGTALFAGGFSGTGAGYTERLAHRGCDLIPAPFSTRRDRITPQRRRDSVVRF
jgi:hypothetical protein